MSYSSEDMIRTTTNPGHDHAKKKYTGIRRRKWGKWVSEIRVQGSQERLWLGTYCTAEAAAVAHDIAYYCLRRPVTLENLNFPLMLPRNVVNRADMMSPRSVQKAASDAGMAVDAQFVVAEKKSEVENEMMKSDEGWVLRDCSGSSSSWDGNGECLSISVEDYL